MDDPSTTSTDSQSTSSRPRLSLVQRIRSLSWRRILGVVFTLILFGYLFATLAANWQALLAYDWHINPFYLAASLTIYLLSQCLAGSAWHCIVWSMDPQVPYRQGIKFYLQSNPAKRVPGLIWYALGRLYLYKGEGVAGATISVALTLELVSMVVGGVIVYLATAWGSTMAIQALRQWWLIFPAAGLIALILWPGNLYRVVNWVLVRRGQAPIRSQAGRGDLILWSLLEAGGWVTGGLFIYFLAAGVYPDLNSSHIVPVVNSWAASGLVAFVALIVPLGLGLKEVTLAYLLSGIVPWPVAILISLLGRICSIIGDGIGLLIAGFL